MRRKTYDRDVAVLHITESELARDVHGALEKIRQGAEVIVEQDNRPVAVIKSPPVKGRKMSEVIAAMEASGANATVDEGFARDVEEGIKLHREPWTPPS
jgi:antitoxin (DNA-binding transcriptional repressor) of toxin-antitoxin stability system